MNRKQLLASKTHPRRTLMLLASLLVLQILYTTRPASAHVALVRSDPEDRAILTAAPSEVKLWFTEAISMQFSSMQLLDEQNQPLANTEVLSDPTQSDILHMKLPPLSKGVYTLLWKALSETDGHVTQGFVVFGIGVGQSQLHSAALAASTTPSPVEVVLRWANLLAVASVMGALALLYVVLTAVSAQPSAAARAAQQRLRRRMLQWASRCAVGALLAALGLLAWQVRLTASAALDQPNWFAQAGMVLTQTQWGILWLVRAGLLVWLSGGLWLLSTRDDASNWLLLVVGGRALDLLIVQALSGHATGSGSDWLIPALSIASHLLAASIWMGGIVALVVIVLPAMHRGATDASTWRPIDWRRFSLLAAFSVGLLFASGLYTMGLQVASLDALLTTLYGQVLLGKVGFVLLAGVCGLLNAMLLHPRLAAPLARLLRRPAGWTPLTRQRLPRLIGLELIFGAIIFGATGVLTAAAPPRGAEYTVAPESVRPWLMQRVDDVLLTLEVRPNRPGANVINVRAVNTRYPTAIERYNVSVQLRYVGAHGSIVQHDPITVPSADGTRDLYQLTSDDLNQAGPWQIDVVAQTNAGDRSGATFRWVVPPAGELQPTKFSRAPLAVILTPLALIILGLLLGSAGGLWWRRSRKVVTQLRVQREPDGSRQPISWPG